MTINQTIIFYTLICFGSVLLAYVGDKKGKVKYVYYIAIILAVVGGLRDYSVGVDTKPYMLSIENFYKTGKIVWPYISFSLMYGYFTKIIYLIFHNYTFLLFIEALIINTLILRRFWDFRDNSDYAFQVLLYLIIIYLRTFNLNVQYLALSIVFFSTRYLDNNKHTKFLLLNILASLLHTSAIIGILFYFFKIFKLKKTSKRKTMLKLFGIIIGLVAIAYMSSILYSKYSYYIYSKKSKFGFMVFAQLFFFVFTVLSNMFLFHNNNRTQWKQICFYYTIGIVLSFSSYIIGNAGRISYYFMIFEPILYGMVIKQRKEYLFKVLIILWFLIYSLYVMIDTANGSMVFPYKFINF